MKVTNEQLMSKMNSIISKVENIDESLVKLTDNMIETMYAASNTSI